MLNWDQLCLGETGWTKKEVSTISSSGTKSRPLLRYFVFKLTFWPLVAFSKPGYSFTYRPQVAPVINIINENGIFGKILSAWKAPDYGVPAFTVQFPTSSLTPKALRVTLNHHYFCNFTLGFDTSEQKSYHGVIFVLRNADKKRHIMLYFWWQHQDRMKVG